MRPLQAALCVSLGSAFVACDSSDAPIVDVEDSGASARAAEYNAVVRARYFAAPRCQTYACGFNSPFIGHELNLDGLPNDESVSIQHVEHFGYPSDFQLSVEKDELVGYSEGEELRGDQLLGMSLKLQGVIDGEPVDLVAKLVGVGSTPMWVWPEGQHPEVPSYKFVYEADGIADQLLCPSPHEGEDVDQEAVDYTMGQVAAFDAQDLYGLRKLNDHDSNVSRPYDAVIFSGERFEDETAKIYEEGADRWFNLGCSGSSAAKLHLSGHTTAADARIFRIEEDKTDLKAKQAALYAFTGTYCPGAPRLTKPGTPLRIAGFRGEIESNTAASFDPRANGTVEAVWSDEGAQCLSKMRLAGVDPEVIDQLEEHCDLPPWCGEHEDVTAAHQAGELLDSNAPLITFNLSANSCQSGAIPTDCSCERECELEGTCCSDYIALEWPPGGALHSPCVTGSRLYDTDSPCVQLISANDSYCEDTDWDSICVGRVASDCGLSCD